MKAITLWQPWATLMALGIKHYETRSWYTSYRGPLLIHAAKRPMRTDEHGLIVRLHNLNLNVPGWADPEAYPLGAIVAKTLMVSCKSTNEFLPHLPVERICGDYSRDRFAWETINTRRLLVKNVKGHQGFWDFPDEFLPRLTA